jgi:hypothetical protein
MNEAHTYLNCRFLFGTWLTLLGSSVLGPGSLLFLNNTQYYVSEMQDHCNEENCYTSKLLLAEIEIFEL